MVVVPIEIANAVRENDDAPALARWLDASPVRTVDDMDGEDPPYPLLKITAERGSIECAKLLLARGAQIDLCAPEDPETALHIASECCEMNGVGTKLIDLFLDAGADVEARGSLFPDPNGQLSAQTPLGRFLQACRFPDGLDVAAVLNTLLRAGADVDAVAGNPEKRLSAEDVLSKRFPAEAPPAWRSSLSNLLEILSGFRAAGCSWKAYKRGPHMAMLLLRSLRARGRAVATPGTSGYVDRLTSPNLPCGVAWKILEYWRATE